MNHIPSLTCLPCDSHTGGVMVLEKFGDAFSATNTWAWVLAGSCVVLYVSFSIWEIECKIIVQVLWKTGEGFRTVSKSHLAMFHSWLYFSCELLGLIMPEGLLYFSILYSSTTIKDQLCSPGPVSWTCTCLGRAQCLGTAIELKVLLFYYYNFECFYVWGCAL